MDHSRQKLVKICEHLWTWGALLFWKLTIFDENWWTFVKFRRTPYLKTGRFRRKFVKICEIEAHSLFENWQVSTKIGENRWNWGALLIWKLAIFDENWWKLVKLRRTPYLKTGKFRRKFVKIGEIEAHSLFENWQLWAAIAQALRASHRGGSSLGQRPATLFISVCCKFRVGIISRKMAVVIGEGSL